MQMTRSHRFARFLGSRRLLQIKLSASRRDVAHERQFLLQKFVLCGRVFIPFSTKDGKVYLMETDENYERSAVPIQGDHYRISLQDFVRWHNPMDFNRNQV
jgi:RNA-dependent RNA polymerase